ncbi:hypothetical protein NPIL_80691 [Nephila pilipes]|uniref:Uncharacterized protein n=1 Tax=Nephila pilipes TaxID=299642 RepID=A0A8X6T652_NEPPI|nr:hypothetical protein NPIL_80691 [Nephila pilipes]
MEKLTKEIKREKPLDLTTWPKISNLCDISQERVLQTENMHLLDSEKGNPMSDHGIEGIDISYYRLTRYLLLMSLTQTDISDRMRDLFEPMWYNELARAYEVVWDFAKVFYKDFEEILQVHEDALTDSGIKNAAFFISRCLLLYRKPTYANFVLIATFLCYIASAFYADTKCFRILYACEFCFVVLYKRKFWKVFNSQENCKKFLLFCDELNEQNCGKPKPAQLNTAFFESWIKLVKGSIYVAVDSFILNDSEVKLFKMVYTVSNSKLRPLSQERRAILRALLDDEDYEHHRLSCDTECHEYLDYVYEYE